MSVALSREEFEDAVADALDEVPQDLLDRLENVVFLIEDEPASDQKPVHGELLGLYVGVPLPQRLDSYMYGSLPDRIYLFQGPLTRLSHDRADLIEQIRVTTLHEIGHYFGIDDDRLHELGWG